MTRLRAPALALLVLAVLAAAPAAAQHRPSLDEPRWEPGEVIVGYKAGVDGRGRAAARAAGRTRHQRDMLMKRTELVKVEAGQGVEAAVAALGRRPEVAYAQPNYIRSLQGIPNDEHWGHMWGLHNSGQYVFNASGKADADIDAPEAWDIERGSPSTIVAVVDSGVRRDHSDLNDNMHQNWGEVGTDAAGNDKWRNGIDDDGNGKADDWRGWDFVNDDNYPTDLEGHGTHVAGTIGAEGNNAHATVGVAHDVSILDVRVGGADGNVKDDRTLDGLAYAARSGAKVANVSIGGRGGGPAYEAVVANNPGTLYVVSAGNGGSDKIGDNNDGADYYPCNVTQPNLVCVAASTQADTKAVFSNYGASTVDIAAPGENILSAMPNTSTDVFRDGFETTMPYSTGGTNNSWGRQGSTFSTGDWALADSPYLAYKHNTDSWAVRGGFNLSGGHDCELAFDVALNLEPGYDTLIVQGNDGDTTWDNLKTFTTTQSTSYEYPMGNVDLGRYGGQSNFSLAFAFKTDGDNGSHGNLAGVLLDEVMMKCAMGGASQSRFADGTSMAAPHVAGVAALLFSRRVSATPAEVKAAILDNGDPIAATTVSGKRLNAYGALLEFTPPSTKDLSGPGTTSSTFATFYFSSDQWDGGTFECSRDQGVTWLSCSSGQQYGGYTTSGRKYFQVRAINRAGRVDDTPAEWSWVVDRDAPDTILPSTSGPSGDTTATRAAFQFSSGDSSPVTYRCRLTTNSTAGSWESCTPPKEYPGPLVPATYKFEVEATDAVGNPDPTPAERTWRVIAPTERNPALEGWSGGAAVHGDFNGDGYDDLAVGAPGEDVGTAADAGAVHVLYGGAGGVTGNRSWFVTQDTAGVADAVESGDGFGASLSVGDFNGDWESDLAIGVPGEDDGSIADAGAVHVLLGGVNGLVAANSQLFTQRTASTAANADPLESGDRFGATLAAGDMTGDGRPDVAIGVPGEDVESANDAGAVTLMPGGGFGLAASGSRFITQATPYVAEAPGTGDQFGAALALGDYNGDGKADLAVGVPGEGLGTVEAPVAEAGAVHVLAGASSGYTTAGSKLLHQDTAYVADRAEPRDHFGAALAAGNFGGGAEDELAIGVPDEDLAFADAGAVEVLSGASGGLLTTTGDKLWGQDTAYVLEAAEAGDHFGASLAAGNFGGGAQDELAIGSPDEDVGAVADAGLVNVLNGAESGLVTAGNRLWSQTTPYFKHDGAQPGDHFGAALAAGDFGDSSEDDLIVGVPDESADAIEGAGVVQRAPGSSTGLKAVDSQVLSQATYAVADAPEPGDGFGAALGR